MNLTIFQGILLVLALAACIPVAIRFFKAPSVKEGFKILFLLMGILGIAASFYRNATVGHPTMDRQAFDRIDQLDAANIAADRQRLYREHPELRPRAGSEAADDGGISREFNRAMMLADVPALSEICKRISADPFSSVTIRTITDRPEICGVVDVQKIGNTEVMGADRRRIAVYQFGMTDSKGKRDGSKSILAMSWNRKSGSWALESAICSGSFFNIGKKP